MNKPVESLPADKQQFLRARTDKYFTKTREIVERFGDTPVTYGVFLRHGVICAVNPAIDLLRQSYPDNAIPLRITRLYEEGAFVPDQKPIFTYTGSFAALAELETLILQRCGVPCVCAYNAYKMAMSLRKTGFIDMHARHGTGDDFSLLAAYGASVGSRIAKLNGAVGFVGSSQDLTAHFYGQEQASGTMPHALVGYAGSTLKAAQMYVEAHPEDNLTVLIDYFGAEYTDAIQVCRWWYHEYLPGDPTGSRTLSLRLDTHGERYAEGLNYERSVEIVADWLHVPNEYEAVRHVMGEEAFDADTLNITKDRVRRVLFGTACRWRAPSVFAARSMRTGSMRAGSSPRRGSTFSSARSSPRRGRPSMPWVRARSSRRASRTLSRRPTSSCTTASRLSSSAAKSSFKA
jgi:nicotinate phosphoribosyltransferase